MSASIAPSEAFDTQPAQSAYVIEAERIRAVVGDQRLLSQSRCVDNVLDLLKLATHDTVRAELTTFLTDNRKRTAVDGDEMRRLLDVTTVADQVESTYLSDVVV